MLTMERGFEYDIALAGSQIPNKVESTSAAGNNFVVVGFFCFCSFLDYCCFRWFGVMIRMQALFCQSIPIILCIYAMNLEK